MGRKRLRPYQREAYKFLRAGGYGALFLEMRLGKTLIVTRLVVFQKLTPCLVVAPPSALGAWEEELQDAQQTYVNISSGTATQRVRAIQPAPPWVLVNWQAHRSGIVTHALVSTPWKSIILDESAQYLRNPKSKVSKFFTRNFNIHGLHKFILTGTPAPESLLDYYTQMQFLLNGTFCGFSNYWTFRKHFFVPDPMGYVWTPKKDAAKRIMENVNLHSVRLKRKDVNIDQPKVSETRRLSFPQKLRTTYNKLEREFVLEMEDGMSESYMYRLPQYVRLRQLSSGINPLEDADDPIIWDGKMQELESLLTGELKGESVVVWFTFTSSLKAVEAYLQKTGIPAQSIHGGISMVERETIRKDFTWKYFQVLLCQVETANTGMNLSVADTAIYYERPPGYLSYRQSEDRILKVGDKHPLLIVHLVTENTVDADMTLALKMKHYKTDSDFQGAVVRNLLFRQKSSKKA